MVNYLISLNNEKKRNRAYIYEISKLIYLLGWSKSQGHGNPETQASQHSVGGKTTPQKIKLLFGEQTQAHRKWAHTPTYTHKEKLNHTITTNENWEKALVFEFLIQVLASKRYAFLSFCLFPNGYLKNWILCSQLLPFNHKLLSTGSLNYNHKPFTQGKGPKKSKKWNWRILSKIAFY